MTSQRHRRAGLELKSLPADLVIDEGGVPGTLPRPALLHEGGYAMLLGRILRAHGILPRGVIHLGGNVGQEAVPYMMLGVDKVVFVEPAPEVCQRLRQNVDILNRLDQSFKDLLGVAVGTRFHVAEVAVGAREGETSFFVTGSDLFSSTRPPLDFRSWFDFVLERSSNAEAAAFCAWAPEAVMVRHEIKLAMTTLDRLTKARLREGWSREDFNILNMNIQGGEIDAISGGAETLKGIELIVTEVNFQEFYRGCALYDPLDALLRSAGFIQVTLLRAGPVGTAIYVRPD